MAYLRRTRDGEGYYGSLVEAIRQNPDTGELERELVTKPRIGWALKVGTVTAGTYSTRDWWMTTEITEIIEEDVVEDEYFYYKFRTGNSIYEYWAGNVPEEKFDWKGQNNP